MFPRQNSFDVRSDLKKKFHGNLDCLKMSDTSFNVQYQVLSFAISHLPTHGFMHAGL